MWPCPFPQRDPTSYFFSRKNRRHNYGIQYGWEGGGGGEGGGWIERISTNRTVQYCSVLYSTIPYCTVLFRTIPKYLSSTSTVACKLACLYHAPGWHEIRIFNLYLVGGWRKQVIAVSMAFSRHTFFFKWRCGRLVPLSNAKHWPGSLWGGVGCHVCVDAMGMI